MSERYFPKPTITDLTLSGSVLGSTTSSFDNVALLRFGEGINLESSSLEPNAMIVDVSGEGFPYTGSAIITGSLEVIGPISSSGLTTTDTLNVITSLTASGLNYPTIDGNVDEVMLTDGAGNLFFGQPEKLHLRARNDDIITIEAGTPVYSTGEIGGSERIKVRTAKANDPFSLPAVGIAETRMPTTGDAKDGFVIINGIYNTNITPVDNNGLIEGAKLYVAPEGGLTPLKPSGSNLIQNIGTVLKTNGSTIQGMKVSSIDRTNDVPNLLKEQIFFGSGSDETIQTHISSALDSVVLNNITASGIISSSVVAASTVTATTGSFSHLKGNSPITVQDPVIFQHDQGLDVLGNATIHSLNGIELETISKNFNYTSSLNVAEITSSVESVIMDYRLTNLSSGSRAGTFIYTHNGTDLNYIDTSVEGVGIGNNPILSATLTGSIISLDIENAAGFNFRGFAKKFSKLNVPVTVYDPNVSYFLDIVDNDPAAAFSLRQLSQLHTGSAIRVREDSGNTEADIGFDLNGNLDEAAIISHCGSANGYVTTWYDQSGNGNNATNTNASKQWAIYNGSSVYTVNGKPAMYSNGTNKYFTHTLPAGTSWSTFDIFKGDNSSTIGMHTRSPYAPWMYLGDNTTQTSVFNGFSNAELYQNTQQMSISTRIQFRDDINNGGQQVLVFFGDYNAPSTTWYLGTSYGNNYGLKGWLQESIIYNTDESSKRSDYETSINNYYSIYDTGLLVDYPGATAAYSVRRLTTTFTSSMNIRRASDNAEQVIGFTSAGDLDTGSIETFCAGTECYVDTWYDQSGNGNDAAQTNAGHINLKYTMELLQSSQKGDKAALQF